MILISDLQIGTDTMRDAKDFFKVRKHISGKFEIRIES
jgi:hypothetical protein